MSLSVLGVRHFTCQALFECLSGPRLAGHRLGRRLGERLRLAGLAPRGVWPGSRILAKKPRKGLDVPGKQKAC